MPHENPDHSIADPSQEGPAPADRADDPAGPADDHADAVVVEDVAAADDVVPVDLRDYVSFSLDRASRVRTLATERLALDQWCLEPQQSTGVLQYADSDVIHTVIGGRAWFVTEQGEVGLDPLGALLVPAGTVHGIDNRGTDPLIVATAMAGPDRLPVTTPQDPAGLAIRDDEQYGRLGQRVREGFQRLFGR